MNIQIITSSYPAYPDDPSGTMGLFVRQFAIELAALGHGVIVQPVARKKQYQSEPGVAVAPMPWRGGDHELASMSLLNPINWWFFFLLFIQGAISTTRITRRNRIDRNLCILALPSGFFGFVGKLKDQIPYDIWVLGSDIWKIRKVPILGRLMLKLVMRNADRVYADGFQLCRDVEELTGVSCGFLPSSRKMPSPDKKPFPPDGLHHFLFVGRYHPNKGPDLLVRAIDCLPLQIKESVRLHMFGLGPLEKSLKQMISDLQLEKYVYVNGPVEAQNFSNYLSSVSFLVIPSRIESIPVVFSDSLQAGTPVVSTPVGDLEFFITEYQCGIVAKEVTPEALAEAIREALTRDRSSFREAVAKAYEQFDIGKAVRKWLDIAPARSGDPCPAVEHR